MDSSTILPLVLTAVAGFLMAIMFSKLWLPFGRPPEGVEVHSTRLGILQKIMLHRWQILLVLGLANVGSLPGVQQLKLPPAAEVFVVAGVVVVVLLPTRYRFTKDGFALGRGALLKWTDFKRYRLGPGRIQFESKGDKGRRADLFVNSVQQAALKPVLKRYFRAPASGPDSSSSR